MKHQQVHRRSDVWLPSPSGVEARQPPEGTQELRELPGGERGGGHAAPRRHIPRGRAHRRPQPHRTHQDATQRMDRHPG